MIDDELMNDKERNKRAELENLRRVIAAEGLDSRPLFFWLTSSVETLGFYASMQDARDGALRWQHIHTNVLDDIKWIPQGARYACDSADDYYHIRAVFRFGDEF